MFSPKFALLAASCCLFVLGLAAPCAVRASNYELVWQDEFDGTQLDTAKWEAQIGDGCPSLCGWGNNELQYYRAENAIVSGGFLSIRAKAQSYGGRAYTSARLRTKGLADWTYGKIEMRAKLPIGQGLWPAFWMLPTQSTYGTWPASGEIDIMEYLGQNTSTVFGSLQFGGPTANSSSTTYTLPSGTFADMFHTFGLEWEPNQIRWFVDGVQYACTSYWSSSGGSYPAPFDKPFHLLLNLAVGGNLPGPPNGNTPFPQDYIIDYVRVWQKPQPLETSYVLFDGMDHANPYGAGWFTSAGGGGGGIGGNTTDLPPDGGCRASLGVGWGGPAGYIGVFGRRFPVDLTDMTHFEFWIHPDASQTYTLQINLQDDDNGDNIIPSVPDGRDDEFQYNLVVSPTGPGAIAGGGWQRISIPLSSFFDDNSYHWGGNGVLDPFPVSRGGNGQLINVVIAIISPSGGSQTFRTDLWRFRNSNVISAAEGEVLAVPRVLGDGVPNPFGSSMQIRYRLAQSGPFSLAVYDLRGRLVRSLAAGRQGPGTYFASWDGRTSSGDAAASGLYIVRFAGETQESRKVVLRR